MMTALKTGHTEEQINNKKPHLCVEMVQTDGVACVCVTSCSPRATNLLITRVNKILVGVKNPPDYITSPHLKNVSKHDVGASASLQTLSSHSIRLRRKCSFACIKISPFSSHFKR